VPAETHVEGAPIGRDEVLELVRDRLADILEIEPTEIAEGASFADDLEDLRTVRDAVDYVVSRLG
jgi:acyl carrier protein